MRILVLTNLFPPYGIGGYEERCLQTVQELAERGHAITVLTSNHGFEDAPSRANDAQLPFRVERRLKIHGFYGHPWLPIHRLWELEQHNNLVLKSLLGSIEFDVVHVWNMGGISKSLLHRLEQQKRPVVYDVSDHWIARSLVADVWLSWWNQPGSLARRMGRRLLSLCGVRSWIGRRVPTGSVKKLRFQNIYFCSAFLRQLTAERGYPVAHGDVIYCGVDVDRFAVKAQYRQIRRLLWVGRLAEDKDPLTALRGFAEARKESGSNLELYIYGRGSAEYKGRLENEIAELGVPTESVKFDSADREKMHSLYANFDAYIFSSNWGEPFALTPLEAMASAVPVIMCPDGGDAELAEDGENAIVFRCGDADSLASAIQSLLVCPDKGESLAQSASQLVRENYSLSAMTDHIEAYLEAAIARS